MIALKDVLAQVDELLAGTDADASEREWIACEALGTTRGALWLTREVGDEQARRMTEYAKERASGKPLWQVFGYTQFCGLRIEIDGNVLCPRPETEELVGLAARYCGKGKKVLDLCTGSGCIAVALAATGAQITASDVSEKALKVARKNADANGAAIKFVLSDLWDGLDGRFDVIVTNPPYIPSSEVDALDREVKDFEPRLALDGGEDGLDFYRRIALGLDAHLADGGILFAEIGADQAQEIRRIFDKFEVGIYRDMQGKDRMAAVKRCGKN